MVTFRNGTICLSLLAVCYPCWALRADDAPLTVFVFAGQSNMVGK